MAASRRHHRRSSLFLFIQTAIIEILLSRSMQTSKAKNKQNINFFFRARVCVSYVDVTPLSHHHHYYQFVFLLDRHLI